MSSATTIALTRLLSLAKERHAHGVEGVAVDELYHSLRQTDATPAQAASQALAERPSAAPGGVANHPEALRKLGRKTDAADVQSSALVERSRKPTTNADATRSSGRRASVATEHINHPEHASNSNATSSPPPPAPMPSLPPSAPRFPPAEQSAGSSSLEPGMAAPSSSRAPGSSGIGEWLASIAMGLGGMGALCLALVGLVALIFLGRAVVRRVRRGGHYSTLSASGGGAPLRVRFELGNGLEEVPPLLNSQAKPAAVPDAFPRPEPRPG